MSEYRIEFIDDKLPDGSPCVVAAHPDLPGCMSHGSTREEASANLREARELYLGALKRRGISVPEPSRGLERAG